MQKLDVVDAASLHSDLSAFRAGDTVKVHMKIIGGSRSRVQTFQGAILAHRGHGAFETFIIRRVSFGVGVERTFSLHTPTIGCIEVVTEGDVRRAKLYHLRGYHGRTVKAKGYRSGSAE